MRCHSRVLLPPPAVYRLGLLGGPDPLLRHPAPEHFGVDGDLVQVLQLAGNELGARFGEVLPGDVHDGRADEVRRPVGRHAAFSLVGEAQGPFFVALDQPPDLPGRDAKLGGCGFVGKVLEHDLGDDLDFVVVVRFFFRVACGFCHMAFSFCCGKQIENANFRTFRLWR